MHALLSLYCNLKINEEYTREKNEKLPWMGETKKNFMACGKNILAKEKGTKKKDNV